MKNSKLILQEICGTINSHHDNVKAAYEAYDSFVCALKKYDVTTLDVVFDTKEMEHEKIVWQILADLRRARDIDLDYDEEAAGWDSYYLYVISNIIEKNDENIGLIETSAINQVEYEKFCKEKQLVF